MLIADNLHGDYYLGLAQRIQVGGMSVWLILWGIAVCAQRTRAPARAATSTAGQVSSTS
ncbi:Uncharacterised protein [Mycobacteroides abscessus subsp. abscessus]|nr:Uncharacterised protein [Mycobacteroides abscessus subsp. abscessus]